MRRALWTVGLVVCLVLGATSPAFAAKKRTYLTRLPGAIAGVEAPATYKGTGVLTYANGGKRSPLASRYVRFYRLQSGAWHYLWKVKTSAQGRFPFALSTANTYKLAYPGSTVYRACSRTFAVKWPDVGVQMKTQRTTFFLAPSEVNTEAAGSIFVDLNRFGEGLVPIGGRQITVQLLRPDDTYLDFLYGTTDSWGSWRYLLPVGADRAVLDPIAYFEHDGGHYTLSGGSCDFWVVP